MARHNPAFLLVLAICLTMGLAGCTEYAAPAAESSRNPMVGAPTTTSQPGSNGSVTNSVGPVDNFDWSSCNGLGVGVDMLSPLYDAPRPREWSSSQDNSAALGVLAYGIMECERIAWGPFERGPVKVMYEWHNDFETPGKCSEGDFTQGMILSSLWFSDEDLALYAKHQFGMPAQVADIEYDLSVSGQTYTARAAWSLPGGEVSEAFMHDTLEFPSTYEPNWRLFWDNGVGASYIDMHQKYTTPQEGQGIVYGTLAPPMLYGANMPTTQFATAGQSDLVQDGSISGKISRFGDLQCAKPL